MDVLRRYFGLLVVLVMVVPAVAQDCGAILAHGIWEEHDTAIDGFESSSFANWACSNSSSDTGIGVGYEGFEIKYSNQEVRKACARNEGKFTLSESFKDSHTSASKEIAEAWSECMGQLGGHASVSYGSDANQFTILLSYLGQETTRSGVTLRSNTPSALDVCSISSDEIAAGIEVIRNNRVTCTRPATGTELRIDAVFKSGGGSTTLIIPHVDTLPACTEPDNCLGLVGSYMVGAQVPCAGARGLASIFVENGQLLGQNPCGEKLRLLLSTAGELAMGGLTGSFDGSNNVIFWNNQTQWINTKSQQSIIGDWHHTNCSGTATISSNSEGFLAANNGCGGAGSSAHLALNPDLSVVAHEWGGITGKLVATNRIVWSNNTFWTR